ncbi:MAG: NYN domain-containing protein [Clostridiaceae bacterium]|nr:NYN domain-containing protein [Clostridiaceae bacterium]
MLRAIVFIDHQNFQIALNQLYNGKAPFLDYTKLPQEVVKTVSGCQLIKTYMFVPKPDEFLSDIESFAKQYRWAKNLNSKPFFEVIDGRLIAYPTDTDVPMDKNNRATFKYREKGTDINMALRALKDAFFNAFDIAFFMSADSDYIGMYDTLRNMGKLTAVVAVKGQAIRQIRDKVDKTVVLAEDFFSNCLRNMG